MARPSRIYCKVIGCLSRETIDLEIIGGPGVPPESFHPHGCITVAADLVPMDKRFPNSIVWFDCRGEELVYMQHDEN